MNDTKYDFNFLIDEQTSLAIRLISEIMSQTHEFKTDPKGYIKSSFANDVIGRKRGRLLLFGMAVGAIFLSSVLLMAALFYYSQVKATAAGNPEDRPNNYRLFYPSEIRLEALKKGPIAPKGGGSGGNEESLPPAFGALPPGSLRDSIVAVSEHPPTITNPSLPVMPTVLVRPDLIPPQPKDVPFGLPKADVGAPSDGPGKGKGIGNGDGHGVGTGKGPGVGPGKDGGIGGDERNDPNGSGLNDLTLSAKMQILTKPRPDYTEQARTDKVQGLVVIEATFKADGQITNVHVLRGLGYGLDEKAMQAVMQIKFRPAERQGRPVDTRQRISVSFQLL